jgi:hypothetical protein
MAIAMGWHKPDNVAGSSAPAIMVGLFVATGGLLFGYDTGYASQVYIIGSGLSWTSAWSEAWKHENRWKGRGTWDE